MSNQKIIETVTEIFTKYLIENKQTAKNYLDEHNKIESNFEDDEDCFIEL